MNRANITGFTLIEITIVLALVGIIASFGVAMSVSSLSRTSITQERDMFVTLLLQSARTAALVNKHESAHGVYIDNANHRYVIFEGDIYNPTAASNRPIPYTHDNITVSNTGGNTIIFTQLSGDVSVGAGTISISNSDFTQDVTVRLVGQIDW